VLDWLRSANETLAKTQKRVEDHLETKRQAFPRFCFLSNDELLEILAQARNPMAVQPHLIKCFDCIKKLDFAPSDVALDITTMISSEGEVVPFIKPVRTRGAVEEWLSRVEDAMAATLHKLLREAHLDAPQTSMERLGWCRRHPSQLVLTAAQIGWCEAVVGAFEAPEAARLGALEGVLETARSQLADLAREVSGDLPHLLRRTLVALITSDVHARDITETMVGERVSSKHSFTWQMQLRFEWSSDAQKPLPRDGLKKRSSGYLEPSEMGSASAPAAETEAVGHFTAGGAGASIKSLGGGSCIVQQASSTMAYGFEYEGVPTRLVVTPLTDRCWMTLSGALHLSLGGAPAGPAGTGKTESVKDLAKGLAKQCIVYNCSDQLDYKTMGKLFSGVAQCGCWTCLDEFNRINIEVLSVS
jgi:dynein heavy chain, axonemal